MINAELGAEYTYPEDYDASGYADYYYQQQQEGGGDYYASYQQQEGYDGYYSQQESAYTSSDPFQYQYSYDTNVEAGGQEDYNASGGYGVEQQMYASETPQTLGYSPEEDQQLYLDQLTTEQTAGYYYDEQGNLIDGYGGGGSPTNVFSQEAYWRSERDSNNTPYTEDTTSPGTLEENPHEEVGAADLGLMESSPLDSATTDRETTPEEKKAQKIKKTDKSSRAESSSRKKVSF